MEHTKTPWLLDKRGENLCSDGKPVCVWGLNLTHSNASEQTKANAAFIVKAVNNHDKLLGCLKELVYNYPPNNNLTLSLKAAQKAIKQAEEE